MAHTVLLLLFVICGLTSTVGPTVEPAEMLLRAAGEGQLSLDPWEVAAAAVDFGGVARAEPLAVMRPGGAGDVARLVRAAYRSARWFPVSARGHGHSTNGQALAPGGVVVQMSRGRIAPRPMPAYSASTGEYYVDVWGGDLWVDVLNWTLANGGLAPKSWTDYLYLSSPDCTGDSSPQGTTPSLTLFTGFNSNSAILLVRWIRVLYSDFAAFTRDQELLVSLHGAHRSGSFDYVEGFVIVDEGLVNNWRSSFFFSPKNPVKRSSVHANAGLLYCLEMTKNYDDSAADSIDEVVEALLGQLGYIPASVFTTDLPYVDFLDRVHKAEMRLRAKGLWAVPHPWLNLFVPASRIADFDRGVFRGILGNKSSGPILIYPMNKHK
ncbi:hypothetical protein B296_00000301 [Ensete ventricosum]|uniref:Cytokinin dehydrogenase 1 FAD/cytokinin binding domain-containing protein n=1 Tax=Ensete ventricosum TaxID=4639 RepID=A0A427AP41_ENSVE|nr:hypothetical protein B296_00000301 [Ensete ventricosum]